MILSTKYTKLCMEVSSSIFDVRKLGRKDASWLAPCVWTLLMYSKHKEADYLNLS